MKYAVEMGSLAVIYIPSFIKIGSGIQKLLVVGIRRKTARGSHKTTLGKYFKKFKFTLITIGTT
jgi:hypothetical protein